MIKSPLKIVCDSGPIIHLGELNCLHLLADFKEILISNIVYREIKRHRRIDFKKLDLPAILLPGRIPDTEFLLTYGEESTSHFFLPMMPLPAWLLNKWDSKSMGQWVFSSGLYGEARWKRKKYYVFSKRYHPKPLCI